MRRVVVTGIGVVSCIGNDAASVLDSLQHGRSGISFQETYKEKGFRSQVAGSVSIDLDEFIDRKAKRFMAGASAYAYIAMQQAIEDARLGQDLVSNERTGLIVGSGGGSPQSQHVASQTLEAKGIRRVGPYVVPKTMCSTTSACLATPFKIKGINYSISSACATSAHCIGNAYEQIQLGKQDVMFAGGGEEEDWTLTMMFDAMGALSSKYNDTPETASRPYDASRDGFVIASGGGILVLEELEHAKARGAKIYAEIVGYGATSDGFDMVAPSGEGAVRCMKQALGSMDPAEIDYINTHGTSTPVGDTKELEGIKEVFGSNVPAISSTKSLTGHSLGATSAHEAIFSLLMMENKFIAASANVTELDPVAADMPIVTERQDNVELNTVMSNSFGFGGTNACLVFKKLAD